MLQPTKQFSEGAMLPLLGVLDDNDHVVNLNLADTSMQDRRFRFRGNGNSNARILNFILKENKSIEHLDLSNTGLDDDGLKELAEALKVNKHLRSLKLAGNYFGITVTLVLSFSSLLFFSFHSFIRLFFLSVELLLGVEGIQAIANSISSNTSIPVTYIDISRNALSYQVQSFINPFIFLELLTIILETRQCNQFNAFVERED